MELEIKSVELTHPLKEGERLIEKIDIRKPMAGELRGVKLLDVLQMDPGAYATLLPRITEPAITSAEFYTMDPADLTAVMGEIIGFFVSDPSRLT